MVKILRFNVHQLVHLAISVRMLGPLWVNSMFPLEGGNGKMVNLVSSANGVPLQIAGRLVMRDTLSDMTKVIPLTGNLKACADKLMKVNVNKMRTCVLGASTCHNQLSHQVAELLFEKLGRVVTVERYLRARVSSITVHGADYARAQRTCSCYLKMQDKSYWEVKEIFLFHDSQERIALLCKRLIITKAPFRHASHIYCCEHLHASEELHVYLDEEVESQLVFVKIENCSYVCEQPNAWETD